MTELSRTQTVSRSAFLELQDELRLVKDGYEFLDEKRILLAAEMLRQRNAYTSARKRFELQLDHAINELVEAAADQGLNGLQVIPVTELVAASLNLDQRQYVGLTLLTAKFDAENASVTCKPLRPFAAVESCAGAFRDLLSNAASLAALAVNLMRLIQEYRRTERRVRALENVVLPEIHADLATMEERLDVVEQEEVIRVRIVRGTH